MGELVLGIESSCDDTGVAIVDRAGRVLSSVVMSQGDVHSPYGGVFPELAARAHLEKILPAISTVLAQSGIGREDLRAIGVTRAPGLIGSLSVGVDTARGLAAGWKIPVHGVNHLRGHLRSADLEERRVVFPAVVLLVSGGHTLLAYMRSQVDIELLGSTRDDSVGETYDKVSRMLGLGYPGGPVVDRLAGSGAPTIAFPRPMLRDGYEFSFSGLKTAVRVFLERNTGVDPADVAASFVSACMDVLLSKARLAIESLRPASLVVVGGVAASPQLRAGARDLCEEHGVRLCLPPLKWSTDNGAMIALATWDYIDLRIPVDLAPQSRLDFGAF